MKFEKTTDRKGVIIPRSALTLSGFAENETAALHALPCAVVLLKKHMTAMDMIRAVDALTQLSTELLTELSRVCGFCDDCQSENCPYESIPCATIALPNYLREEAGIAPDAKLCAEVDEEEGTVTIYAADYPHDLTDVPEGLLPVLDALGVCLGELEKKLITGEVVYHG